MSIVVDTIVCPKCGGDMLVGTMPTDSDQSVNVHGICQACDYHVTNKLTVDAQYGKRRLLQNRAWVVQRFRDSIAMARRSFGAQ